MSPFSEVEYYSLIAKYKNYKLNDNAIYPLSTQVNFYNPFDPLDISTVESILENDYVDYNFELHTLFLNLDFHNHEQIYRFVKQFGFLYNPIYMDEALQKEIIGKFSLNQLRYRIGVFAHLYHEGESLLLSNHNSRAIYLKEFREEIERMRLVIELYMGIKSQEVTILSKNTQFLLFWEYNLSHPTLQPIKELLLNSKLKEKLTSTLTQIEELKTAEKLSKQHLESLIERIEDTFTDMYQLKLDDLIIEMCIVYLEAIMEVALKGVSPKTTIGIDGTCGQTLVFSGLLSAMYFNIHQDFLSNKMYKRCQNPNCHHLFIAKATNKNYCSSQCQTRAKSARLKERKKAQSIKLYDQGLSIIEIAEKLKVEPERVHGWIYKIEKVD